MKKPRQNQQKPKIGFASIGAHSGRSTPDAHTFTGSQLYDSEEGVIVSSHIINTIDEVGTRHNLSQSSSVSQRSAEDVPEDVLAEVRRLLSGAQQEPYAHAIKKELQPAICNINSLMLEKLQYLRERPLPEGDLATPSRAALGALEDIVRCLPDGSVTRKPSIGSDGMGGAQIIWRFKKTHLLISASAGGGAIVPDVYMFFRKDGVRQPTLRFDTSREYADSILTHLSMLES